MDADSPENIVLRDAAITKAETDYQAALKAV